MSNKNNKKFLFWTVSLLTIFLIYDLCQTNAGENILPALAIPKPETVR